MKGKMRRLLSIVMTLIMILGAMPMAVFSVEDTSDAIFTNGYYNADGEWVAGGNGTLTHDINGTEIELSKTLVPVEGLTDVFEVTLRAETSTTTTHYTSEGAVVLVLDTSGSMDYCAECSGESRHTSECSKNSGSGYFGSSVSDSDSRMAAAKSAAISFIKSYAGTDEAANRMLAIVSFDTSATNDLTWVNVAGGEGKNGYDSAIDAIEDLYADGGTNLDAGLKNADELLKNDAVKDMPYKSVIAMTDGVPTYYIKSNGSVGGSGSSGSSACNSAAAARADSIIANGSLIYSVCFGAENDRTYSGGPTVGEFLKNDIASAAENAYAAADAEELMEVFKSITEDITEGLNGAGWNVTDPMTDVVEVVAPIPSNFTTEDGTTYRWNLSDPEVTVDGDVTTYVYTCTYRVKLNVQAMDFEEGKFYPTNGPTFLNIDGEQYAFPVPAVKGTLPRTSVSVSKVWVDADDQDNIRPTSATVQLYENGKAIREPVILDASNNWTATWDDLVEMSNGQKHLYTVEELNVPTDYVPSYTGEGTNSLVVTNTHEVYKTNITVTKVWDDNDNQDGVRPDAITVNLLKNGEKVATADITANSNWSYTFNGFDVNTAGIANVYTVEEESVDGYTSSVDGFVITNTHRIEKTSVNVAKFWDDNNDQDGKRPNDVTVNLLANGEETGMSVALSDGNGWSASFADLDKYANGSEIVYTVAEVAVPEYETTIEGDQYDGFKITNSYIPETVEVSGSKTWIDNDNQDGVRPGFITINLLQNGTEIAEKIVTAYDNWTWTFDNLPKYENKGTEIVYSITEDAVDGYTAKYNGYDVTNTHAPEKTSVTVIKSWVDNDNQDGIRANEVTVKLIANGKETDKTIVLSAGNNWTASFADLDKFEAGVVIDYTVAEVEVPGYETEITGDMITGYIITNTHTPETVTVSGSKTWIDNNNQDGVRPEFITINLIKDGVQVDAKLVSAADDWAWSFADLPKYENEGTEIIYSITEDAVDGYTSTVDGYNVTNTHAPEKTSVSVTKAWVDNDNQDGIRTNEVIVKLLANGKFTGKTITLSAGNTWTATFSDLDKFAAGNEIVYSVEEISVSGYTSVISGNQTDGYTITNSHTPETVKVCGSKTWKDNNNQDGVRPESITINLIQDGKKIESKTVTAEDNWTWTFDNLPKFRDAGTLVEYAVTEDAVDGYTTTYNRYCVTNTHAPEKTSVSVSKVWNDSNDQDGIRPCAIIVKLIANGKDTCKTITLNDKNGWTGVFTDLDKFAAGTEIVYTIDEVKVMGYTTVITGNQTEGYTITNSHNPATVSVSGSKVWKDNNDQDGVRPESIAINLLKNGKVFETKTVTEADGWKWTFENLDKFENHGKVILYSVTENAVDGYTTTYCGCTITNTHAPAKTSVTVSKVWVDNDDQDGIRPNDITVTLLANGKDTGKTIVLSQGNKWTDSFADLDKFEAGKEITYTVAEVAVSGYSTVITGNQTEGYTITNTHTPETVTVSGSKTWDDNDNQDGIRPESITINLLKNGEVLDTKTVTEADGWAWSFENLDKYENHGTLITYSVTENGVEGYTTEYNGFDVTNTHAPEKTSVTVTTAWVDNDDQDGIRPEFVTVKLIANGIETGKTMVLSQGNNWTDSFTDLDKFAAGVEIVYTVEELPVDGYTTEITGTQADGYTVINTHIPAVVTVSGSKTWDDNNNQDGVRPESITINLLKNGEIVDTKTVTEADNWAWSFENLAKFENHGSEINYSVTEGVVDSYSTEYNGYNVTNTHAPEKTSVTVTKSWQDNNDQDGIRVNDVTVKLLANGKDTGKTIVLSEGNNWTASFTELDKFEAGKEIAYTVDEIAVEGYATVISGSQAEGFVITNSHTPETVEVAGSKTWVDNDNQDGVRPESITINLLKNGEIIESKTVTEADGWKWAFANLPKYENKGTLITYSITENAVEDYSAEYDGFNVTNTHTPAQTSVTVTKAWEDNNDQDGIRPDAITVKLLANGKDTGKTIELTADNNWTASFTELDKFEAGAEIAYTASEITVDGYTSVITGSQAEGFVITNSHITETVEVAGSKTWNDNDNQDGVRPTEITINLLKNGEIIESKVVTEADGWAWTFTNLPKYENGGSLVIYSITENAVADYSTEYDGYNVINTHTPGETSITVSKVWEDSNDEDGIRPDKVTIKLLANGEDTGITLELSEANKWTAAFTNVPEKADGEAIEYTVEEIAVNGYNTVITGDMEHGFTVTNSHTVVPQTGDSRDSAMWFMLMSCSGIAFLLTGFYSKKRKRAAR